MYDSDELRALAKAAQAGSPIAQYRLNDTLEPETVLELLDEIDSLRCALKDLSAMYSFAWDRVDGALVTFDIKRFETAHAKAKAALDGTK
jgi:hypothetical protein